MKLARLTLALVLLLACVLPAQAGGPGPYRVHLPIIGAGCDMTTYATLEISDGDVTIDLLRGNVHLADWKPAIPALKSGGIWQDSALATGRRMVDRRFGNVSDSLSLVISSPEQDDTIGEIGDLLRLLEKARDFTASSWQSDPVWIKRQAGCETNPTYALVYDYKIPQLSNPYAAPFAAASRLATMNNFILSMEHSIWLSCRPGTGECVQTSGVQTWNYGSEWAIMTTFAVDTIVKSLLQAADGSIYAGADGNIYQSLDDGVTWVLNTALPVGAVGALFQAENGYLYAGDTTQIWRSVDNGLNWISVTAAPGVMWDFEQTGNRILAGDSGGDLYYSDDDGTTWALLASFPYNIADMIRLSTGRLVLVATDVAAQSCIYVSDDSGNTWTQMFSTVIPEDIWQVVEDSRTGDVYAIGYRYFASVPISRAWLWISRDHGATWDYYLGLNSDPALENFGRAITQAPDGTLYAGAVVVDPAGNDSTKIWCSLDGVVWTEAYNPADTMIWYTNIIACADNEVLFGGDNESGPRGKIAKYSIIDVSAGRGATCSDETFIANKQNVAQLTHVFIYDAAPVTWTSRFPATFPYNLFPAVPAVGDILYAGIESAVFDSGPFESIMFDIGNSLLATSWTVTWEFSDGAAGWPALTVQDGTRSFGQTGVNSVHWTPPATWVVEAVNGVTAWWVRARITAIAGSVSAPTQANRDLYTANQPYADIAAAQVAGDIPALAEVKLHNRSDADGRGGNAPNLYDNRIITGLRSYDRGPTFTAYLNASDEQNPAGVTVTLGANTTVPAGISGITGKLCTWAAALGDTTFVDRVTFTLGPTIARDFYGTFHAFLRATVTAGAAGDIHARLQVRTGSGGVTLTSIDDYLKGTTDYEVLDLGRVSIPASGLLSFDDLGDSTVLAVQFRNDSGAARTVYVHDLILIPVDECAVDATDYANITLSVIGLTSSTPHLLDIDSLAYHKVDVRTLVRSADGNGFVTSVYVPGGGPMVLQANAHQRLWAFAMQTSATGTTYVWLAPPWIAHSIQVFACERWLGLRGDR